MSPGHRNTAGAGIRLAAERKEADLVENSYTRPVSQIDLEQLVQSRKETMSIFLWRDRMR